jgi:hypothetical protein
MSPATLSRVSPSELRARQRRNLNDLACDSLVSEAPDEPVDFDCECGRTGCRARVRLTPREFSLFRRDFRGFVVAPGHEFAAED